MKLIVDDIRTAIMISHIPPWEQNEWTIARTVEEAKVFLRTGTVTEISLDHDMGIGAPGGDVPELCKWMSANDRWPSRVHYHTANLEGGKAMIKEQEDYQEYKKQGIDLKVYYRYQNYVDKE